MKLLLTLDFPPERGGIQRYLFDRVTRGYEPGDCVVTGGDARTGPALPCRVVRLRNPLARVNSKFLLTGFFTCLLRRECAGAVIECGNLYAAIAPWILSFFRSVDYRVFTYGGELLALQRPSFKTVVLRSVLWRSSGIYALGAYTAALLQKAGIAGTITIEPPRIDLPPEAAARKMRGPEEFSVASPLRLLSVGRLVAHKGHEILLEACRQLPAALNWRLIIVGTGPLASRLTLLCGRPGLAGRVELVSGISDEELAAEYRRADLFIHPSLETRDGVEGFGIVLLEAMAAGVPIIASRTGGIPEVVADGECGMLVEPGEAGMLAEAMVTLAKDREGRRTFAERAHARVRERYAWR